MLLVLALASIIGTTAAFGFFLSHTGGYPVMFDEIGKQRTMAMQMVLGAHEIETDSTAGRARLEEASEEFDRIFNTFAQNTEFLSPLVRPYLLESITATRELWGEISPRLDQVIASGATTEENRAAREFILTEGPRLVELSANMSTGLRLQMETTRGRIWFVLLTAVVFNLVLVVAGYILIRRRIVAPLQRLEEAALTLRSGRLGARVESGESNEIGLVERAFNDMAREIEGLVASLEERRAFAESLITHAPVGVVVHRRGEIVFANPHLLSLVGGGSLDELTGRDFVALFHPQDRYRAPGSDRPSERRGSGGVAHEELRLLHRDDEPRTVEAVTVSIDYEGTDAAMTILRDITEREKLVARMMQIDRVAALGTLLAGMGHEINNPLNFLTNNLEFSLRHLEKLEEDGKAKGVEERLPEEWSNRIEWVADALRESRLGAERIRDIVARLRSFSRIDETPRQAIDLVGALESSIRMAEGEIRHRARLVRDIREAPQVEANESQMGQVFLNLLINAAHAIEEGNAESDTITVSLFSEGNRVIVEVRDTGSGIPREVADRIFDPFFTTKPPGQGTGLGLSICQKIVETHGGLLTFTTSRGVGTTFRISLPAAVGSTAQTELEDLTKPDGRRRRFAIIDDDPMVCRGLQRLLERENEVHTSTDARLFLERVGVGEAYDVVFCDLMMPGMTGMELHDILAERHPDILSRTIFMTGGAFTPQAEKFLSSLDSPLLLKPFDLNQVLDLVARMEARQI